MDVMICPTAEDVGRRASARVAEAAWDVGPDVVLGVATGSSPLSTYRHLAQRVRAGELDLSHAWAFALDEYVGLPPGHAQSYASVIRLTVTDPLWLDPTRVFTPDGSADDLAAAAARYEEDIRRAGGIDVQVLGLGSNGHIGFNEPGSPLDSRTRLMRLTEQTRKDNSRFFGSLEEVPTYCLTQGLGTIREARRLVLVAHGTQKAAAVAALVEGPVTVECPASVLKLHPAVSVIVDESAASRLSGSRRRPANGTTAVPVA